VLRRKCYHVVQARRFSLGHDIDAARAIARCTGGVPELSLPKRTDDQRAKLLDIQ